MMKARFSPTQLNNSDLKGQSSVHSDSMLACSLHKAVALHIVKALWAAVPLHFLQLHVISLQTT